MLYLLADLRSWFGPLRLFEYVTFRSGCALLTAPGDPVRTVDNPETETVLRAEIGKTCGGRR